jgi:hypothetical protein
MKRLIQILVIGALVALLTTLASAQVPQMINYQGKLTTAAGAPLNGNYQMVFTIYDADVAGNVFWTETQPAVAVDKGVFNVLLGSVSSIPYSVFDGSTRYLGVKVGGDPEITPRKAMVSVPYAYRAGSGGGDNKWIFRITDTADTSITTGGNWGIARYGNVLYGNADSTHVNLGVACTTGTIGYNSVYCTVGGGNLNAASGWYATVGGGVGNIAYGNGATVGGGAYGTASGSEATVGGGDNNTAGGNWTTVGGGRNNTASGEQATVGGGRNNTASFYTATVGGGLWNTASGDGATVGGGDYNTASGVVATVVGGETNTASGIGATVGGGQYNSASGDYSFSVGYNVDVVAQADYTFAFGNNFTTSTSHAVVFYDATTPIKVGIQTTSPAYTLDVNGDARISGVIRGPAGGNGGLLQTRSGGNGFSVNWTNESELKFYIEDSHVKTFVINHPLDQSKYLVHGTLEGAEAAVYYRGTTQLTNGIAEITLPSYFETLVRKEGRTILLTNIDGFDRLAVKKVDGEKIRDGRFVIVSDNPNSSQEFDWEVKAIRQDVPLLVVEPDKKDIEVRGDGPYTYTVQSNR